MEPTTRPDDRHAGNRHVSADVVIGLSVLGVATLAKLLWTMSDGGVLAALGAR